MARTDTYYAGEWWRSSRYVIQDGFIRAAGDRGPVRYSLWQQYYDSLYETRIKPPHESLLHLAGKLEGFDGTRALTEHEEKLITGWCSRHGLLGVLLHQVQSVTLAPRWATPFTKAASDPTDDLTRKELSDLAASLQKHFGSKVARIAQPISAPRSENRLQVIQRHHRRTLDGRWSTEDEEILVLDRKVPRGRDGQVVPPEFLHEKTRPHVGFLYRFEGRWVDRPMSDPDTWTKYFPSIAESERDTYPYPSPATKDFWKLYSEPVDEFLDAAFAVAKAIRDATPPPQAKKRRTQQDHRQFNEGVGLLNGLLGGVSPAVYRTPEGVLLQRWVAPSLISAIAMMAIQKATSRFVRLCRFCRTPFQARTGRASYCSGRCRNAAQKVRNREGR